MPRMARGRFRILSYYILHNCEHKFCAKFERIREDLALINVDQLVIAIIELFKNFFLLIVQCREQGVVMVGDISHQLLRLIILGSAIGVGADIAVE